MFWVENYPLVLLINVTRLPKRSPTPLLLDEERYQVANTK